MRIGQRTGPVGSKVSDLTRDDAAIGVRSALYLFPALRGFVIVKDLDVFLQDLHGRGFHRGSVDAIGHGQLGWFCRIEGKAGRSELIRRSGRYKALGAGGLVSFRDPDQRIPGQ